MIRAWWHRLRGHRVVHRWDEIHCETCKDWWWPR